MTGFFCKVANMKPLIVVMGVSGSGKSTIGELLARRLKVHYLDADNLHPESNVQKMASGIPLNDDDRWPWLAKVGEALAAARETGLVVACSALKRSYRDLILKYAPETTFLLLDGPPALIAKRLKRRKGHFMPTSLLESQFASLEPLAKNENGITVDVAQTPRHIVAEALAKLDQL